MPANPKDAPSDWFLAVRQSHVDGEAVFTVAGRLSNARAAEFVATLAEGVDRTHGDVVVDLRGLDYISSAGLRALESLAGRIGPLGRELILCNPAAAVRLALDLAGPMANVRIELTT